MRTRFGNPRLLSLCAVLIAASGLAGSALATTAKPSIHNFLPRSGKVGTTVTITGKNFTGATGVTIDGLSATFKVRSATRITAAVPATAKTGKVRVKTKAGTATSTGTFLVSVGDGLGTLTTAITTLPPGSSGDIMTFTYTATAAGMSGGVVTLAVPAGWTAPVTTNAIGCTSATVGTVSTSGQTITISGLTLAGGGTTVITYGATSGGACTSADGATASTTGGAAVWQAQQKSTAGGTLTNLAASPSITVSSTDGLGTVTPTTVAVPVSSNNDVLTITYAASTGGMTAGSLSITVPSGWTAPVTTNALGCTTASAGTLATSGQTITVTGLTLAAGATMSITYGAQSGGSCAANDGATAPSTAGALTFAVKQASTASGTLTAIGASPVVTAS